MRIVELPQRSGHKDSGPQALVGTALTRTTGHELRHGTVGHRGRLSLDAAYATLSLTLDSANILSAMRSVAATRRFAFARRGRGGSQSCVRPSGRRMLLRAGSRTSEAR